LNLEHAPGWPGRWGGVIWSGASVLVMAEDEALQFAERLLALLDATRYAATYKLATLLALIDAAAERTAPDGAAPATLSAKDVGRRVIELYWPQTIPYGTSAHGGPGSCCRLRKTTFPRSWRHGGLPGACRRVRASKTRAPQILKAGSFLRLICSRS
jgi:hypothetical protein